ncbi:tautomerase family protein [Nitrosomonas aestuarii]|uniref:4-oxalocrotonate tautomerase n=1 Tax=Nitrosomonas aestuarii TaxID=52441 RepID=A0A1I4BT06_9PROT|nr:4-oxalocrotonate tautomerase family protein [Nitrosomonas aestuarii]PTN12370.1 4-oxalocrotonate tautomerase [Nitrosomonas aestuarii]SFK71948.1 4-oxalocrotonate tautomerase [Nitrosomonas aestuarii]
MPYVHLRVAGTLSSEQKAKIAEEFTDTLARVANKSKSYTYITFEEVPHENWAIGGALLAKKT